MRILLMAEPDVDLVFPRLLPSFSTLAREAERRQTVRGFSS
jgi:hypothetical protein